MAKFTEAYNKTLANEGGYSNDPRDHGGETYKGIARNMHPKWEGWAVIDETKTNTNINQLAFALKADEELDLMVRDFYKLVFWDVMQLDSVTPQEIAEELFDTGVNQGTIVAIKHLQEALNLLNNNQKHYSDINEDGKMGPASLKAISAYMLTANFPGRSVAKNMNTLIKVMNGFQFQRYVNVCNENPMQEVFAYGWMNRV